MEDQRRGIYRKYFVQRLDEDDQKLRLKLCAELSGGRIPLPPPPKHENCEFFVLDLVHDPFAAPALRAYAKACAVDYPILARELLSFAAVMEKHHGTGGGPT